MRPCASWKPPSRCRGENGGRLLRHAAVVQTWKPLGAVGAEATTGTFRVMTPLMLDPAWNRHYLRAVVAQENGSRRVVDAGSLALGQ